jgi:hypothetical protein
VSLTIRAMRNHLGTSDKPFYALASVSEIIQSETFIDRMASSGTSVSKPDIIAVFQLAREELGRLLAEGCFVKTPLGVALPVAKGAFREADDPFLPKRAGSGHELRIEFRIDPAIEKEALASIRCVRDREGDRRAPILRAVAALPSGERGQVEAGGLLKVMGTRMKFDPTNHALGLFFKSEDGRVTRAAVYAQALPSSLIAIVPRDATEGSCRLLVRTISKGGEILEGQASAPLTIRAAPIGT